LPPLCEVAFELGDGDQPCAPLGLDRRHRRHDAAVERREADAEGLGSLPPRVRQPLDPVAQLDVTGVQRSTSRSTRG
jgi:hypothetical protein